MATLRLTHGLSSLGSQPKCNRIGNEYRAKGNDMRRRVAFFATFLTVMLAIVPGGTLIRAQTGNGHVQKQGRNWNGVFRERNQGPRRYMGRIRAYYGLRKHGHFCRTQVRDRCFRVELRYYWRSGIRLRPLVIQFVKLKKPPLRKRVSS